MTDESRSLDGLTPSSEPQPPAAAPSGQPQKPPKQELAVKQWKALLPLLGGSAYVGFLLWCGVLIAILPDATGALQPLVPFALITAGAGALMFLAVAALGLMRISAAQSAIEVRKRSLIRLTVIVVPGLLMSAVLPIFVLREPGIAMDIESPKAAEDFIAPVTVTYSLERAVTTLSTRGLKPVKYEWDLDSNGKPDEETVVPKLSVNHERDGVYTITARILLSNGTFRRASRRIVLQQAVFTVQPPQPIIERPALFSVANLVPDKTQLKEIQWDFTGDGKADEVTKDTEATFTFFQLGKAPVSVTILLTNNTQATYSRSVDVIEAPPLAFPATMETEPSYLMSPPPFGVRFRIDTNEPIATVAWTFGDGEKAEGQQVAHTFEKKGSFPVNARIRSKSGSLVELNTIVRVAETLNLPDLRFEGTPTFQGDKISGEIPLSINLRPRTSVPFVTFLWEVPEATEVGSTQGSVQAIYREAGIYTLTLVAEEDTEDRVFRKSYTVEIKERTSDIAFIMRPESGVAPLPVIFDASESFIPGEEVTGYEWTFGDKSPRTPGGARAEHTYADAGTYVVSLTIRTVSGKTFETSKTIVVRPALLSPCITTSRTTLKAGGGVRFDSSCSTGSWSSLSWDFGDGQKSEEPATVHVFEQPGEYEVSLILRDPSLRETRASVTITVTE